MFYQTSESSPIKKRNTEVARYPYEQLCLFTYGDLQCCRKHARITKLTHTKYYNQPHNHAVICQYRPSTGNLPKESSQGQRLQKSYIATTTDSNQLTKQQYANWENIRMDLFFIFQKWCKHKFYNLFTIFCPIDHAKCVPKTSMYNLVYPII